MSHEMSHAEAADADPVSMIPEVRLSRIPATRNPDRGLAAREMDIVTDGRCLLPARQSPGFSASRCQLHSGSAVQEDALQTAAHGREQHESTQSGTYA